MDLKAKKKKHNSVQQISKSSELIPIETPSSETVNTYEHSISIQCNTLLYTTLQNTVKALHTGNDFTYTSVTDIIRAAIKA